MKENLTTRPGLSHKLEAWLWGVVFLLTVVEYLSRDGWYLCMGLIGFAILAYIVFKED